MEIFIAVPDDELTNVVAIDPLLEEIRAEISSLSSFPDARTGLTFIQSEWLGLHYCSGEWNTHQSPLSRILATSIDKYRKPSKFVLDELFRLIQEVVSQPIFRKPAEYDWFEEISMQPAELISPALKEFLETEYLPKLSPIGFDIVHDEILTDVFPRPLCLPLHLVSGVAFDGVGKKRGTNFPPHNLTEIIDALISLIDNPQAKLKGICQIVQGPDFKVGGTITATRDMLKSCYAEGTGTVLHRCDLYVDHEGILHLPVINPAHAFQQLTASLRSKKICGIASIFKEDNEVIIA